MMGLVSKSLDQNEYDQLLSEARLLRKQHETYAKDFVPKMYAILREKEGLAPQDAADRIYKDLTGIWEKDTIRRLLPVEAKNQLAREKQALSRLHLVSHAGLILQRNTDLNPESDGKMALRLEQENAKLKKAVEALEEEKKTLLETTLRLERMLKQHQRGIGVHKAKMKTEISVIMPPHLFMKAFTLMRSSSKPLVLKIAAQEVVDVDKINAC
jgi:hypothetical protein